MASSSKPNNVHHIRSISLPPRSHPTTLQIEEDLNKLKTWESSSLPTAEKIYNGLIGLGKLYKCINDLLSLPLTQHALSQRRQEKWVDELLDQSMRLLDICGSTRDVMFQVKEQVIDLQSALRRRKGDLSIQSCIAKYTSFRRRAMKDAKRLISALKQIDNLIGASPLQYLDHHLISLIRVLREIISSVSSYIFQTLLLFLSVGVSKPQRLRWSMVLKLIQKGAKCSEDNSQILNELESLEGHIKGTENGLESIFRSLIKTRASLLNIMSN